jgi:hypothetical protein
VLPAFPSLYHSIDYDYPEIFSKKVDNPYHSGNEAPLSQLELLHFLRQNNLLEEQLPYQPAERYWPNGQDNKKINRDTGLVKLSTAKA